LCRGWPNERRADAEHREELATMQADLIRANTELTEEVHRLTAEVHALLTAPPTSG
jgi:hypothetical protein